MTRLMHFSVLCQHATPKVGSTATPTLILIRCSSHHLFKRFVEEVAYIKLIAIAKIFQQPPLRHMVVSLC